MAKKPKEPVNDKAWMDTYSDMVTLLLCFFVLLFSMSTLDAQKWQILVQGFNPDAESTSQIVLNQDTEPTKSTTAIDDGGDTLLTDSDEIGSSTSAGESSAEGTAAGEAQNEAIDSMDKLYEMLSDYVESNNLEDQIKLFQGEDYTYVMFSNNIFFDGDSSVLKSEGKQVLDVFGNAMAQVSDLIAKVQVLGHTNQADPNKPNNVATDRFLSSNRAVEVLIYLQNKNVVEPRVLESIGYGQHYPIGSFSDPEGRARNRRVELVIAEDPAENLDIEMVYDDIKKAQASGQLDEVLVDPSV